MKLGDFMVRDPFERPFQLPPPPPDMEARIRKLVPKKKRGGFLIICSRSSAAKNIIDATEGGPCVHCKQPVWLSPSSRRVTGAHVILCVTCIAEARP